MVVTLSIACGTYPKFECGGGSEATCPTGQVCPEVPLDADACGDLPSIGTNPSIPVQVGRPVGCTVWLPAAGAYGPHQPCHCGRLRSGEKAFWLCPL